MANRTTHTKPTTRVMLAASVVAIAALAPTSLGAATIAQKCTGPSSKSQAGRETVTPGINGHAVVQKITAKINLFQCTNEKTSGGSGTLLTSLTTPTAITCTALTAAHTWANVSTTIDWKNKTTSTATLTINTTGATRLANVTGTISAGTFTGDTVSGQYSWAPVISPNGDKFAPACANTVAKGGATGTAKRISVVGFTLLRTKDFRIS